MNNEYKEKFILWKRDFSSEKLEIGHNAGGTLRSYGLTEKGLEEYLKSKYPVGHDIKNSIKRAREVFADEWVAEWRDYYFVENLRERYTLLSALRLIWKIIKNIKLK